MASLIRWEPLSDLVSLRDATNRLFEDSFVRARGVPTLLGAESLATDVYETADSVVVKSNLPGIKAEDVELTITGNRLTIKAEVSSEEKVEREHYLRQERYFGQFQRSLDLPEGVRADKAKASYENGVLTLTVPKSEEVKPKTIKVETKSR